MDAREWDARYAAAELVWSAEPNRWVAEQTAALPAGRALDLACGEGRNAIWLAGRGWEVTGVDFSEVAVQKAARLAADRGGRVTSRLRWVREDVLSYQPPGPVFDLVLVVYLQVPAEQRRQVLRTAAEALAPGGMLLVVAHHTRNLADGVGGPPDPAVLYTEDDVAGDLEGLADLRVTRATEVRREVPGAERPALDLVVTALRRRTAAEHRRRSARPNGIRR